MQENKLILHDPLAIADVGASGGLDKRWNDFNIKGFLFEPDDRAVFLPDLEVFKIALSDIKGKKKFNLCRKQTVSSFYEPNMELIKQFPEPEEYEASRFDVLKKIEIETDTLDNVLEGKDVDVLKIDIQGYELPVLKGSIKTLKNVIAIETEVEFIPIYKNQPLFKDVDSFITNQGFSLITFRKLQYWGQQLIWTDALYFRKPEYVKGMGEDKVLNAIKIYLAYGYFDYAKQLADAKTSDYINGFIKKARKRRFKERFWKYLWFIKTKLLK